MMEQHERKTGEPDLDIPPREPDPASSVPNYVLSPRKVATSALVVAIAAVATLAVVTSVSDTDQLSTIALVLAILAFVIQILVFVVQDRAANESRVRSEQLNSQTRALLAEVRTTAQSTQVLVGQQFNQLLRAFVSGAEQTAEETKFDPVTFEQRLLDNVRSAVTQSAGAAAASRIGGVGASPSAPRASTSMAPDEAQLRARRNAAARRAAALRRDDPRVADRQERSTTLRTFPTEADGREAVEVLRKLPPRIRSRLQELAEDEVNSLDNGTYVGLNPQSNDDQLERKVWYRRHASRSARDQPLSLVSQIRVYPPRESFLRSEISRAGLRT